MALNIVRVRIFWTSNIFVIIVFPYTHDTGTVTGTEPGVEFYTLPLIEIILRLSNLSIQHCLKLISSLCFS